MTDVVEIERLGARGDGIARGETLFVPFTLPGERVRVVRHGERGRAMEILAPAPERATPACPHFGTCGGCALQHAADPFIAEWKHEMVARALAQRGLEGVEIRPTVTMPPASRRRITVTARRTRQGHVIGFHARGSDEIVPISACPVARPELVAALPALGELVERAAGRRREVRITLTLTEGGIDAAVTGAVPVEGPARALLAGVAARAGLARLGWNGEVVAELSPPRVRLGPARVIPPPGGFLQPTAEGEAALVEATLEALGDAGPVVDLFAGSGTFTLPLAETREVHAVDSEGAALAALEAAWRATPGLKRVTVERRDLARRALLARELERFQGAVIDPPHAGARWQAGELAKAPLARLAHASCNPATFARDARTLVDGGWRLDWVQPVDQFRWSAEIELLAAFSRPGARRRRR